jgi:hypothetical protein
MTTLYDCVDVSNNNLHPTSGKKEMVYLFHICSCHSYWTEEYWISVLINFWYWLLDKKKGKRKTNATKKKPRFRRNQQPFTDSMYNRSIPSFRPGSFFRAMPKTKKIPKGRATLTLMNFSRKCHWSHECQFLHFSQNDRLIYTIIHISIAKKRKKQFRIDG